MKIFYDITAIRWGNAGVSTYACDLRDALVDLDSAPQLLDGAPIWRVPRNGKLVQKLDTVVTDFLWRPFLLPVEAYLKKCDLVHMLYPRSFPLRLYRKPVVVTVHDLYALEKPEIFSQWDQRCNRSLQSFLKKVDAILTVSNFTRVELLRYYPSLDPARIHVIHNGFDRGKYHQLPENNVENIRSKLSLKKTYFLFVSTLEPRKNVLHLLEAFIASGLAGDYDLLLAGGDGWVPAYIDKIETRIKNCPSIRRLGYVDADDLPALYAGARAFVYPSLYEGFGIPVLEAMACECPVICSKGSSLDEIAGTAALQVDPSDVSALSEALTKIATDDILHAEMKSAGIQQAAGFSWKRCAEQTRQVYQAVLS